MKAKVFFPLFLSAVFLLQTPTARACNYTVILPIGIPVDNGNGTYTISFRIMIGITISWGGTTNFSITPSGGSFTTISSFSPMTLTSNYIFCPLCSSGDTICTSASTNVTATADGVLNVPQTAINFNQSSSLPAGGCSPPAACWGNGFPFVADDYQTVCVSANIDTVFWNITIVTNGYPFVISFQGAEDDIGPDINLSGGGCPESLLLPPITSIPKNQNTLLHDSYISKDLNGNHLLSLSITSPQSFTLNVFSADGKKVSEKNYLLGSGKHQIPVYTDDLEAGIYFCRMQDGGVNRVFKFVK